VSGTEAAAGAVCAVCAREAVAVPDLVVSAAVPDSESFVSSGAALPAISSRRCAGADRGKQKKRQRNPRTNAATTAKKKKAKATSKRGLPPGIQKTRSGNFQAKTKFGGKHRNIGTFHTPEQASAIYMSVKKDLNDAKPSALSADEADAAFDAAKKKALEAVGLSTSLRDLPTGVRKRLSGKFTSSIGWGGKSRYIGTFDTPEQASAAYMSVRKYLEDEKISLCGADELTAIFSAARKIALKSVGGFVTRDLTMAETEGSAVLDAEDLLMLGFGGSNQSPSASAATDAGHGSDSQSFVSASAVPPDPTDSSSPRKQRKKRTCKINRAGAAEAAKKKSKATAERDLPQGVQKVPSGKFGSQIRWGGKKRYIGTFDTPKQASAAYISVRKELDDVKLRPCGSDKVRKATFDAAKKRALEALATR